MKRQFLRGLILLSSVAALVGCFGANDMKWTEDVKLPDGRIITLKRFVELEGRGAYMSGNRTESLQRFEFEHPAATGEVIRWENRKDQGLLRTVALWLDQDKPRILTVPAYGDDFFAFNCPNPPYLLYEYSEKNWRSLPLAQVKIKRLRSNVTAYPRAARESIEHSNGHLGTAQTLDSYVRFRERRIVPSVIRFEGMPEQTFEMINCDRQLTELLIPEEK